MAGVKVVILRAVIPLIVAMAPAATIATVAGATPEPGNFNDLLRYAENKMTSYAVCTDLFLLRQISTSSIFVIALVKIKG